MNKKYEGRELNSNKDSYEYFDYYTVQKGDNLYRIAKENNIDIKMLAKINGLLTYDYLYPNQTLIIPKENTKIYITKENDTIQDISKKLNISLEKIIKSNPKLYLLVDQLIVYED